MAAVQAAILKQDKLHLNKIHVCVADLRQTRFPDNYFDLIFVRETVEYISSKAPVLTEFLVSVSLLFHNWIFLFLLLNLLFVLLNLLFVH